MLSQSGHGWLLSVRNMAPNNFISMHFWYFRKFGKLTIKGASCQNLSRFQNARRWGALAHSPLDRILVHRGLFPLPSPLSLVPNVSFPWCFLGNMTQAIWSRHCERKRIAQAWLQKMVILHDSLTVLRHRVFNPLSGIPRIFRRGHYTNKKRTSDWRSPHPPHGEPWRVF